MTIYFVTSNTGKFDEAKRILPGLVQMSLELPEIQSLDPRQVIRHKLIAARETTPGSFVVEDTSLTFAALGGMPGPLVKSFLDELGLAGLYELAQKLGDDRAEASVMLGYLGPDGRSRFFGARLKGRIVAPRGLQGFGWDGIFQPEGYTQTFGEMEPADKQGLSMRRLAFEQLKDHLETTERST